MSWPMDDHERGYNVIRMGQDGKFSVIASGTLAQRGLTEEELIKMYVQAAERRITREIKAIIAGFDLERPVAWEDLYVEGDEE